MHSMRILFALIVLAISGGAQHLDFGAGVGVKGGFPATDLFRVTGTVNGARPTLDQTDNYLVGPVGEIRIPFGFAFEVNGLYRGTQYHIANAGSLPTAFHSASWEIPYLGKFRFPIPLLKPFISIGGAYRTFTDLPSNVNVSHNAFVAGSGLELRIKRFRASAEGRYLRWGEASNNTLPINLARDQGEVLFGIIF